MKLLSYPEIAKLLDVKEATLRQWVRRGRFPKPDYKAGQNSAMWKETTVDKWRKK